MNLLKFRSFNANNLVALSNNQLWFSSLENFNDPFEGEYSINNDIPADLAASFIAAKKEIIGEESYFSMLKEMGLKEGAFTNTELFQKIAEHDINALIKIIHKSKVASFSLSDPKKPIRNPVYENLMWSHYADGLRGFCLIFDLERLYRELCDVEEKAIRAIEIRYQDQPNEISLADFAKSKHMLGVTDATCVEEITETIATKSIDWKYEKEVRLLSLSDSNFHAYSPENLIEIVIGEKMPKNHRKLIIDLVRSNNPEIRIREAKLQKNSYKIKIDDLLTAVF